MEEEKNGISLTDIFKTIWSQKWLALIIAAVILIAGTLGLHYGYGALKEEYTSTFSINVPENSEGSLLYPDGTARNYRVFTSLDNLKAVKALNEEFSGINVEKMYKESDISISQSKTDSGAYTYTLRVKSKYFSSSDVAALFLNEIASTPTKEIYKWVGGLSDNMAVAYEAKLGNELKLNYLKAQLKEISSRFNSLGGLSNASKDKLNDYMLEATALTGELHTAYYEPSAAALQNYKYLIHELEESRDKAQAVLDKLKGLSINAGSGSDATVLFDSAELVKKAEEVAALEQQIKNYKAYIDKNPTDSAESEECKAFTAKMEALLAKVQSLTSVDESNYYKNTGLISYDGAQIKADGGMGLIKSAVISFVAGLVIAMVVAYIVGYVKASKADAATETAAPAQATAEKPAEQTEQN